jgi:hypothetical protein
MAQHTERHIALLRSARQYTVELTVYSGGDRAQTMAGLNTDLLGSNWKGACRCVDRGGFTQLRGDFALLQPLANVPTALAHATGVGCFAMSVNDKNADWPYLFLA